MAALLAEPGSITIAPGVGPFGTPSYGNGLSIVVGASGSLTSRRSRKTAVPALVPSLRCSRARKSELATSLPPPLPKIEPMKAKPAIASVSTA